MPDDLLDSMACIDWAESQLDIFRERIKAWVNSRPYTVTAEKNPQTDENVWKVDEVAPLPRIVAAEAGAIINALRSSLDLLTNSLAQRNGHIPKKDVYFPVCTTIDNFNHSGRNKIKGLSAADQAAIECLQPYNGGHIPILLWALHDLDVLRKHKRLLQTNSSPHGIGVYKYGSLPPDLDKIISKQPPDDGYVLPRGPANHEYQIHIRIEVTFSNLGPLGTEPAASVLKKFADATRAIVLVFDR